MIAAPHILTPDTRQVDWTQPVADHPLNDGLVSWWLAIPNHTSGTATWRDLCGKNDGTLTNFVNVDTAWKTQGQPGGFGALDFDGTNDYVVTPSIEIGDGPFTWAAWVRGPSTPASREIGILAAYRSGYPWWLTLERSTWGSGNLTIYVGFGSQPSPTSISTSDGSWPRTDTGWHFCAVSRSSESLDLWLDDTYTAASSDSNFTDFDVGSYPLRIGHPSQDYWNGTMSDIRAWDRALTASEIQDYYQRSQRYYPGLLTRHTRRSIFKPISTGVTISPPTLTMTGSLQGAPPNISRTINVT